MPSATPLAPKGQLMKHTTAILLVLSVVLFAADSCEARGLGVHGENRGSSKSHLQGKVGCANNKLECPWLGDRSQINCPC
nr:unnamed protein product [Digitaria exilis]